MRYTRERKTEIACVVSKILVKDIKTLIVYARPRYDVELDRILPVGGHLQISEKLAPFDATLDEVNHLIDLTNELVNDPNTTTDIATFGHFESRDVVRALNTDKVLYKEFSNDYPNKAIIFDAEVTFYE